MSATRRYYIMLAVVSAAVTSIASHRLNNRNYYERERNRLSNQISILNELIGKYRSGVDVEDAELRRLLKLADLARVQPKEDEGTTVMELVFGRKSDPAYEEREMKDLMEEWRKAFDEDAARTPILSQDGTDQTS